MSDARIDQHQNVYATTGQQQSSQFAQAAAIKRGVYLGQMAEFSPYSASFIDEVAEEAGVFASERYEKEAAKRKAKDSNRNKMVDMQEMVKEFFDMSHDVKSPEAFMKFMDLIRKMGQQDVNALLRQVAKFFEDVSDQYRALMLAENILEKGTESEDLLEHVKQAKDKLMNDSGPAVRAGLNIAKEAINASKEGLGEFQELRDFYRDIILGQTNISGAFKAIRKEYGEGNLDKAIAYLIKAAGNDLAAQGPSLEPSQLKAIIDNMYQVETLSGVDQRLTELLRRIVTNFDVALKGDSEMIMDKLLDLASAYRIKSQEFLQLAEKLGLKALLEQIYFLTGLNEQVRLLPLKIYESPDNRTKLLEASQEALDEVIYEEEEQEEEGDEDDEDGDED